MTFNILSKDKKTKARVGRLKTKSGSIETPFFMPVATKTAAKHISSEDLHSMSAKAIISNAFVLSLRPGADLIKKMGGIGEFMSYSGITFTDSGGFQMYSPSLYLGSREEGVMFRDPYTGEKKFVTPEENMETQLKLGSDVAMCLDSMPLIEESKEAIREAVRKTTNWAKRCKIQHDKLQKNISKGRRQLLFGICQGGIHGDLREISAKQISSINFDGYSIGGLALGEAKEDEYKMIEVAKTILPEHKPVYLMGAGEPVELLEAISRGVDMFDSRFPTKNARRGTLFTSNGRISIRNAAFKTNNGPIDKECACFVCKTYTCSYLRHLLMHEEGVGLRLASYHNLYFLQNLMQESRKAIKQGKFKIFVSNFKKKYISKK